MTYLLLIVVLAIVAYYIFGTFKTQKEEEIQTLKKQVSKSEYEKEVLKKEIHEISQSSKLDDIITFIKNNNDQVYNIYDDNSLNNSGYKYETTQMDYIVTFLPNSIYGIYRRGFMVSEITFKGFIIPNLTKELSDQIDNELFNIDIYDYSSKYDIENKTLILEAF